MRISLKSIIDSLRSGETYPDLVRPYLEQEYPELMEKRDFRTLDLFLEAHLNEYE